jgi:hypothetical protein
MRKGSNIRMDDGDLGDCGLRNPPGITSGWSFPSGSAYFRGAEDLCVYKEASTASVKRIKHKHNHFYLLPEIPTLRSFHVLSQRTLGRLTALQ